LRASFASNRSIRSACWRSRFDAARAAGPNADAPFSNNWRCQ
jgi:hypothetical protein